MEFGNRGAGTTRGRVSYNIRAGMTALAAKEQGRAFIGIELSPAFCDLAETRKARQAGKRV